MVLELMLVKERHLNYITTTYGMNNLGYCYEKGIGTRASEKKAFELYQKAEDSGMSYGISNLGCCHEKGIGTEVNEKDMDRAIY